MRRGSGGFSVIEALVAVAIIAIALLPLIGLEIQLTRDSAVAAQTRTALEAQRNALAVLRDINPAEAVSGERQLATGIMLRWRAQPISQTVQSIAPGGGDGGFNVTLYRIHAQITLQGQARPHTFDVDQLGWRQIATINNDRSFTSRNNQTPSP